MVLNCPVSQGEKNSEATAKNNLIQLKYQYYAIRWQHLLHFSHLILDLKEECSMKGLVAYHLTMERLLPMYSCRSSSSECCISIDNWKKIIGWYALIQFPWNSWLNIVIYWSKHGSVSGTIFPSTFRAIAFEDNPELAFVPVFLKYWCYIKHRFWYWVKLDSSSKLLYYSGYLWISSIVCYIHSLVCK